jgi:NADH dehydrogenase
MDPAVDAAEPHIVIVGAGFGGLMAAKALGRSTARVTIVDRHNYHLFVPLLYQVATAALSPADIARPIRRLLARYKNIEVLLGEGVGVDGAAKRLKLAGAPDIPFDKLIISTGSTYSYFGHDDWEKVAPAPKTIADARMIRSNLLLAFERAEIITDPQERQALLTTIVVGGGPTGVEMAGAVAELTRHSLARDFRHIDPRSARVLLVEAGPRLLANFPQSLSDYAREALTKLGVTVMTGQTVEDIKAGEVTIGGKVERAACIIWGAGVKASPVAGWLAVTPDRAGRIPVNPDLSAIGCEDIYVIGDSALLADEKGVPLPALAQVAAQQGTYLGKALRRKIERGTTPAPFRFHNRGNTAIIGRNAAVFDFGWLQLKGRIGWLFWAIVHIYLLTGFENRLLVAVHWLWLYLTYERGARLIAEEMPPKS